MKKWLTFLVLLLLMSAFAVAESDDGTVEDVDNNDNDDQVDDDSDDATDDDSVEDVDPNDNDDQVVDDESDDEVEAVTYTDDEVDDDKDASDEEVDEVEAQAYDDETEEEVKLMLDGGVGAKMRLLQLERAVLQHVIVGNVVMEYLDAHEELSSILDELHLVLEDVRAIGGDSSVEAFVEQKREAKDLVSKFKEIARPLLSGDDRDALHEKIKRYLEENEELQALHDEIKELHNDMNKGRVRKAMERLGVDDEKLLERVRAGELTKEELHKKLKEKYNSLDEKKRLMAKKRVAHELNEHRKKAKEFAKQVKEKHIERRKLLVQKRLERLPEEKRLIAKKRVEQQVDKLHRVGEQMRKDVKHLRKGVKDAKKDLKDASHDLAQKRKELEKRRLHEQANNEGGTQ